MLMVASALKGYAIEATDGRLGTVKAFLFDDTTWKIRWLVVDTGHWLTDRQVLIHPSAIGLPDHQRQHLPVVLTKAQIEASPDIRQDQPVSMQMQNGLYGYYGWDSGWGPDYYGAGLSGIGTSGLGLPFFGQAVPLQGDTMQVGTEDGDPHLRSIAEVTGYHTHATDGAIGHIENFLIDDVTWTVRYLIVDTRNWWPGAHVLISPFAVRSIDWTAREVRLNVSQAQVKGSPPWDPVAIVEQAYEQRLHTHYGWPGYGW